MSKPIGRVSHHPLAQVRQARAWTLADVARIVSRRSGLNMACWRQKVNRWERRGVVPEPAAQHALADELGVSRALVERAGWPGWLLAADATVAECLEEPWIPERAHQVLSRVMESAMFDRRGFLVMSGRLFASAAGASLSTLPEPVRAAAAGGVAGSELVAGLRERVARLWHLDDLLGGGACLPAAASDLNLVGTVLSRAGITARTERALYSVAASVARFAGFAAFDAGRHAAGQRFWHAGLRAAHTAGDRAEAAYILSNLALQDIYVNHARDAVDMLEVARSNVDPAHRTVLSMLDCWQARAHAVRGERSRVATLLNRADDLYDRRRDGDDPEWIYWMPRPCLTSEAGTALREIGDLAQAQRLLTDGMHSRPAGAVRERNLYLVRLAETHLEAGEPDRAADAARLATQGLSGVDSARVTGLLDALHRRLPEYQLVGELSTG